MSQRYPDEPIDSIIDLALAEDAGHGEITSEVLIPSDLYGTAIILVKEAGILAGIEVARKVFRKIDPMLKTDVLIADGTEVKSGDIAAKISGKVASILKGERTVLNFLQRLSGIASLTAKYVAEVRGTRANIYDTRKTTPGLRSLEKYAVRTGGGRNHRMHLGDGILIKDNHLVTLRKQGMKLPDIIARAKKNAPAGMTVEVEVTSIPEAREAVNAGADIIMLDNMSPDEMKEAVKMVGGRAKIEASGGITLNNVRQVALTEVDIISIGALTHSPKALDISLEIEPESLRPG